jgi:hypothetical protein
MENSLNKKDKETIRTSVVLDKDLWNRFKGQIWDGLGVSELSAALDILIERWLNRKTNNDTGTTEPVHAPPPKPPSTGNPDPRQSALIASALRAEIDKDEESELAKMAAIAIAALELYGRRAGTIGNKPSSGQNEDRKTEGHRGARRLNRSQGVDNAGDKAPGEDSFKRGDGEKLG